MKMGKAYFAIFLKHSFAVFSIGISAFAGCHKFIGALLGSINLQ